MVLVMNLWRKHSNVTKHIVCAIPITDQYPYPYLVYTKGRVMHIGGWMYNDLFHVIGIIFMNLPDNGD